MDASQIYIIISISVLVIIILLALYLYKKGNKPTSLTGLALGFIIAGIVFGEDKVIGYSLIGIGVIFAIIDMLKKLKHK